MAINFPDAPVPGQIFQNYVWDGEKWLGSGTAGAASVVGAVRYDAAQTLTSAQAAQARANIWVTKKNYILNGGMQISQENGSTAGTTNPYFPVDQFALQYGDVGTKSAQQIAAITPGGSPNRIRVTVSGTDTAVTTNKYCAIVQKLEGLRTADLCFGDTTRAKTTTLQFGVKAPAGTYCIGISNDNGQRCYVAEYVIAAGEANTNVIKSVVIPGDTGGAWQTGALLSHQIFWTLMAGPTRQIAAGSWTDTAATSMATSNQFNFMGQTASPFELFDVSLTEGAIAPPFQLPDIASELALCQRYWQKVVPVYYTNNSSAGGQGMDLTMYYSPMRAAPTGAIVGTPTYGNCSGLTIWGAPGVACASVRVSSTAAGLITWSTSSLANYFSFNARL